MAALAEFIARLLGERLRLAAGVPGPAARITALLRELGPYAAIELILPGGSLLALLLWLWRRRRRQAWYVAPAIDGQAPTWSN